MTERVVDVIPTLQTLRPQDVAGRVAVVVDVLRATSTIVTAMAAGTAEVRPAASPVEARARLARLNAARGSREGLVLGGERFGLRIEGFDLGNSPLEYTPAAVGGRTIFFATTNGTRTLRRAAGRRGSGLGAAAGGQGSGMGAASGPARQVLVAAFLNASAVAERIWGLDGNVVIICAGTQGGFSLEDVLLAGFLVDSLERRARTARPGPDRPEFVFRDLARASAALYRSLAGAEGENLASAVVATDHARYLVALGFAADVAYCASRDLTSVVPEFARGRVRAPGQAQVQAPVRAPGSKTG
jgi:2-phosphosulfolactate phosphatase